jgi:hypothetical protein
MNDNWHSVGQLWGHEYGTVHWGCIEGRAGVDCVANICGFKRIRLRGISQM